MSDKKSLLNEIVSLVFGSENELKFIDAKSGDLIVRVEGEDFKEGLKLLIVTPDGAMEAEDGTYALEDGRELYVKGGLIEKIEVATETPEAEVVEAPEMPVEMSEEFEVKVDAAPYVDETGEIKKEEVGGIDELMARLVKCEEMIAEMSKANEKMSEFSKIVEDKIDTFIKDTPAELEFKSIKSEFNSMLDTKKTTAENNLEAIRNLRAKK